MMNENKVSVPKVSIIIPTYNEELNIRETLLAIKNQKCNITYEVIVSDGQSTDNTVKIAEKLAKTIISPVKGKAYQVNYAVRIANGEILILLDADTIIPENYIQYIYNLFMKNKNLFACSARFKYTSGIEKVLKIGSKKFSITPFFFQNTALFLYYTARMFLGYPELAGCNISVRKDIFLKVNGFKDPPKSWGIDKVFSDSVLFLIKKLKFGKIKTINSIHVLTSARRVSIKKGLKRYIQYHKKKEVYSDLAKDIEK